MALTTKRMEFENSESMERFLMLYKDLFKPWSEDTIKVMNYLNKPKKKQERNFTENEGNLFLFYFSHK